MDTNISKKYLVFIDGTFEITKYLDIVLKDCSKYRKFKKSEKEIIMSISCSKKIFDNFLEFINIKKLILEPKNIILNINIFRLADYLDYDLIDTKLSKKILIEEGYNHIFNIIKKIDNNNIKICINKINKYIKNKENIKFMNFIDEYLIEKQLLEEKYSFNTLSEIYCKINEFCNFVFKTNFNEIFLYLTFLNID